MITEDQRRALFALREALRLCDEAKVRTWVDFVEAPGLRVSNQIVGVTWRVLTSALEAHPDV